MKASKLIPVLTLAFGLLISPLSEAQRVFLRVAPRPWPVAPPRVYLAPPVVLPPPPVYIAPAPPIYIAPRRVFLAPRPFVVRRPYRRW